MQEREQDIMWEQGSGWCDRVVQEQGRGWCERVVQEQAG